MPDHPALPDLVALYDRLSDCLAQSSHVFEPEVARPLRKAIIEAIDHCHAIRRIVVNKSHLTDHDARFGNCLHGRCECGQVDNYTSRATDYAEMPGGHSGGLIDPESYKSRVVEPMAGQGAEAAEFPYLVELMEARS